MSDDDVRAAFAAAEDVAPEPRSDDESDPPMPPDSPIDDPDLLAALLDCAELPQNDLGNGQRFVRHFGEDFIHVPRVGWHHWVGTHWRKDEDARDVRRTAQKLSGLIMRELRFIAPTADEAGIMERREDAMAAVRRLLAIPAKDRTAEQKQQLAEEERHIKAIDEIEARLRSRRASRSKFATTTGNSGRIDNAMKEAEVVLSLDFEDLDANKLDVNVANGVLRFAVSESSGDGDTSVADVQLRDHARDLFCSKICNAGYDPDATCPTFDAFFARIQPDPVMRDFLMRWLGLSMTARTMQAFAFFYGDGANGKSVLVDLMAWILGDYAATARIESLTGNNRRGGSDATPDLVPLMGARMVRTSEPDEGQKLQEGLIKELTGGEPFLVRALHKDFVEVNPVFSMTMSGNHKPDIRGTDDGIWRRILLVPFPVQIPEAERDPHLGEKLRAEASGVLNRMIDGLIDFLEGGLRPPAVVTDATREYRSDSDPLGIFLVDQCVVTGDPADAIPARDLAMAFNYHLQINGHDPWKQTTVSKRLADRSKRWKHPTTGKTFQQHKSSISQYLGIRLRPDFRRAFEDAPRDRNGAPMVSSPDPQPT